MGEVMTIYNETGSFPVPARRLAELIGWCATGVVSHQAAKRVYADLAQSSDQDPAAAAARLGLVQVSDQGLSPAGWMKCSPPIRARWRASARVRPS